MLFNKLTPCSGLATRRRRIGDMTLVARHEVIAPLDVAVQQHLLVVAPAEPTLESANETVTMIVAATAETESVLAPLRIATVISRTATATVTENVTGTATATESEEMDVIVNTMMVAMELLMMVMIAVSDISSPLILPWLIKSERNDAPAHDDLDTAE